MRRELVAEGVRWVDVVGPAPDDLSFLRDELRFHPLDVAEVQRPSRYPAISPHPLYLFLAVHVPVYRPTERATVPLEVDVFVTPSVLVTARSSSVALLDDLFSRAEQDSAVRDRLIGRGPAYLLYSIMDHLFDAALPMLGHVTEKLDAAEQRIFSGQERQMVRELSAIHRDLSGFRSIIRPQRHLYEAGVLHGDWNTPVFQAVFRSIDNKLSRLWDRLETLWERAGALAATNAVLVDHKLNEFVKYLTVLGAVFIPLGLVAQTAVFLDVTVPVQNRVIFWALVGLMAVADFVILWHARRRNLL